MSIPPFDSHHLLSQIRMSADELRMMIDEVSDGGGPEAGGGWVGIDTFLRLMSNTTWY